MPIFFPFPVQEGLSLVKHGVSPYSGDVVHEVRFQRVLNKPSKSRLSILIFNFTSTMYHPTPAEMPSSGDLKSGDFFVLNIPPWHWQLPHGFCY